MRSDRDPGALRQFARALPLLVTLAACGEDKPYDWKNRVIDWRYGPTTTAARAEHLAATGKAKNSKGPIATGWQLRLVNGEKLTIQPFELADDHESFGAVKMVINLYDRAEKRIAIEQSPPIEKGMTELSIPLDEEISKQLRDVVIWFAPI